MDCTYPDLYDGRSDLPTLERTFRLQETAAAAGLNWPEEKDIWSRINEELAEAKAASEDVSVLESRIAVRAAERPEESDAGSDGAHELLVDELGELLFAVVDVCRILGVDPDLALKRANDVFDAFVSQIQDKARAEDLDRLWDQTKRLQREKNGTANIIWPNVGRSVSTQQEAAPLKKIARA